jgi:hypothetical protein
MSIRCQSFESKSMAHQIHQECQTLWTLRKISQKFRQFLFLEIQLSAKSSMVSWRGRSVVFGQNIISDITANADSIIFKLKERCKRIRNPTKRQNRQRRPEQCSLRASQN